MEYDHDKIFGMMTDGYEHFDSGIFKNQDKVYATEASILFRQIRYLFEQNGIEIQRKNIHFFISFLSQQNK